MFENLFGNRENRHTKKNAKRSSRRNKRTTTYAPNTKIAFKPKLLSVLQEEHEVLLDVFEKATMMAYAGLEEKSKHLFSEFKDLFVDHVLRENTSLYIYLQHSAQCSASKKAISLVKSEMDVIGREIMQFLDHCIDETTEFDDKLLARLDTVGRRLRDRIEEEEVIVYPNYVMINSDQSDSKKAS